jgi:hypothetical protein
MSNLIVLLPAPSTSLEAIFEDETRQGHRPTGAAPPELSRAHCKGETRAAALDFVNRGAIVDVTGDGAMRVRQGLIISQVKSHRRSPVTTTHLEPALVEIGISFRKMSSLLYQTRAAKVQVTAEMCQLAGFRDLCMTSFK